MSSNQIARVKHRYPMVDFYCKSRKMAVSEATNEQCVERLNTVFDDMTANYGVIIGETVIHGLTGHVLQKWFIEFMDGRKPSTINNYVSFLNPFLRWAYNIGYQFDDVSNILKNVRIPSAEMTPEWERKQEKFEDCGKLLTCEITSRYAERDRAMIALFLCSGLRVSELCSLKISSLREDRKLYCQRKGGKWKYVEVSDEFYEYLGDYLATRTDLPNPDAPLFISGRGGHLDRRTVYAALAPIQKKLGLQTGPHALRHSFVSEVDKIGGPTVARDLANHSSLRITNRYDHTNEDQRREVLNRLSWSQKKLG